MIHETFFKKDDKEYKLVIDDDIKFETVIKVMDHLSSNSPTKAGDVILLSNSVRNETSPEIFSNNFLRGTAAMYCLKFYQAFEIEEKKS